MTTAHVTARGRKTMAKLRDAARQAFADNGWANTRVQDIVEIAGVSHGTFYTYYDNRSAILVDLITDTMAAFITLASEDWDGEDARGEVERIIGGFLDTYATDSAVMHTWMQAAREDPDFGSLYLDLRQRFVDRITEQLDSVIAAGHQPRADRPPPETIASVLASMVEYFAYCRSVLGEQHDREDAVAALVLVWGGALNNLAGTEIIQT